MYRISENRRAELRLLVSTTPRPALTAEDVEVSLLRAGETTWREKKLTPASWRDLGRSVYALTLDAEEVGSAGMLTLLLSGRDALDPPLPIRMHTFDVTPVVEPYERALARTTIVGRVVGLDDKPVPKAAVIVRPAQALALGGIYIAATPVTIECDLDGRFSFDAPTGATLHVNIPVLPMQKTFVVPPPMAPGLPLALTSL